MLMKVLKVTMMYAVLVKALLVDENILTYFGQKS